MKSYFRFLSQHKLFTSINVAGFCLSMAFLMLLGDLIYRKTSVENFQTRGDRTFVLGDEVRQLSHFRIGQKLKDTFPEIEDWCSVTGYSKQKFHIKGRDVETKLLVARDNFFTFFDYRLLEGDRKKVLSSPTQIVVSRSFAQRYWPDENVIGKEMTLNIGDDPNMDITYTVSGVMDDFDRSVIPNSYECLVNIENLRYIDSGAYSEDLMNATSNIVFLMQREGADLKAKVTGICDYLKSFFWIYQIEAVKEVTLTPLSTLYYDAKECKFYEDDINHGNRQMTWLYVSMALLVLIFAIFNFVNLSVTLTTDRSKEMATRRLLGSSRKAVFGKLIGESIVFTLVALILGYLVALSLQDKAVELSNCPLDLMKDTSPLAITITLIAVCLTGFAAGFVPAMVLSGYKPIDIVRGTFRRQVRQRWSHILMVAQAVFAIVMLSLSLLLDSNLRDLMSQPLGYNIDNVMQMSGVSCFNDTQRQTLRNKLASMPEIERVGYGDGTPIELLNNLTTTATDGTIISIRQLIGDSTFFNILGIHPDVIYSDENDIMNSAAINHQFLKMAGAKPDAREIVTGKGNEDDRLSISAVYPDMVYQNVLNEREHPTPYLIFRTDEFTDSSEIPTPQYVLVKYHGDRKKVEQKLVKTMTEMTGKEGEEPETLSDIHHKWYRDYERFLRVLNVFTIASLLIAVLGLLAMNSYFVSQRRREIAVRRVFGAEIGSVTFRLLRTVALQSVCAILLAVPLSWWLAPIIGNICGLPLGIEWIPLLFAIIIVVTVNLTTALIQGWRAATENPIKCIKTE